MVKPSAERYKNSQKDKILIAEDALYINATIEVVYLADLFCINLQDTGKKNLEGFKKHQSIYQEKILLALEPEAYSSAEEGIIRPYGGLI